MAANLHFCRHLKLNFIRPKLRLSSFASAKFDSRHDGSVHSHEEEYCVEERRIQFRRNGFK